MNRTYKSLLLAAWVLGLILPSATKAQTPPQSETDVQIVHLKAVQFQMIFDKKEFTVIAGRPVEIIFENPDIMQHNLLISKMGSLSKIGQEADLMALDPEGLLKQYIPQSDLVLYATGLVNPFQTVSLKFIAPREPGDYPYICTFPGHWRLMNGIMKVVAPEGGLPVIPDNSNNNNGEPKIVTIEADSCKVTLENGITIHYDLKDMKITKLSQNKLSQQTPNPGKVLPNTKKETPVDLTDLKNLSTWLWLPKNSHESTKSIADYQDYKIQDKKALLRYKVSGRQIEETPQLVKKNGLVALSHTLRIGPGPQPLILCLGQLEGKANLIEGFYTAKKISKPVKAITAGDTKTFSCKTKDNVVLMGQADAFSGNLDQFISAALQTNTNNCLWELDQNHRLLLHIPAADKETLLLVYHFSGQGNLDLNRFANLILKTAEKENPATQQE